MALFVVLCVLNTWCVSHCAEIWSDTFELANAAFGTGLEWTVGGTGSITYPPSVTESKCPNGAYCWEFEENYYAYYIHSTSNYDNIALTVSVSGLSLETGDTCNVYYSIGSTTNWVSTPLATWTGDDTFPITEQISLPLDASDNGGVGIKLQSESASVGNKQDFCYFSNIILEGDIISTPSPTTKKPTNQPTKYPTWNPSTHPISTEPTTSPTAPTSAPITSSPTAPTSPTTPVPTKTPSITLNIGDNNGDDDDDDDDENSNDMYQGLAYCDNVQRLAIVPDLNDMDNLVDVLGNVIDAVLNKQSHKRMVLIIDRRGNVDHDMLYAYLPLNTQNTPELYVSMVNQTKTELIPSYGVGHDDDELKVENTMDGNSGFMNMFIMSLHLHAKREVAMYWHYCGSCNRFCVMDMVTLWPSHFIMDKEEPSQDTQRIQAQIENEANYDELVDINFETFYAINTGSEWRDTQAPLYRAKPRILQRRSSDEERRENVDKWFKLHEREEEYRTRRQMMKSMRKLPTQKRIIPRWAKLQRHNTVNEGDVKQEEDAICSGFAIGKDEEMEFAYTTDFDENGLLYFLGSYARRQAYKNPVQRELVSVVLSSLAADSKNEMYFVGRECVRCMTNNTQPSYMALNLQSIAMKVSHYTLKHHTSHNVALTSWTLEGSRDGSKWIVLKNHVGDTSLQHPGDTKTWRIDSSANDYLSQFRIYMTSVNNSGRWYLGCSGIELYGHAYGGLVSESLSPDFDEKQNALQQQNLATPFNVESRSKSQNHLAALNDDENKKKMKSAKSWSNLTIKKFVSRRSLDPSTPRALKIKWNVYPKGYKKWVQKGGKVILRNGGDQEQIMFASSNSLNEGCCEFKIKYESIENEYCHDAVGIISNTQACRVPMQWITDDTTIGYISDNVDLKWKSGQVLSVQIHLILKKSYMNFCIDGQKMTNDIPITYGTYYPLLCTQTDDAKFTLMTQ
eukprot:1032943_1